MSASVTKYSTLLDIDTSQPDVYETPDVEPSHGAYDDEPEIPLSSDISTDALSPAAAAARFRATTGESQSALTRYQRSLFRALQLESLSGPLEVTTGSALSETPAQRLRRLVYETQELREQLSADDAPTQQSVALMRLAAGLTDDLAHLSLAADREPAGDSLVPRALWQRLQGSPAPPGAPAGMRLPADVTAMEARIAALERALGASSAQPARDAAVGHSLVDSVSRLRQQMDVLADPQRIDGIQRRVKQVLVDMDRLDLATTQAARADSSAPRIEPATAKRIDELYEKLTAVDSLIELAPATARRLQSLATLHAEASEAVARVARIEREQAGAAEEVSTMKEIAESLKAAMGDNSATLAENMKHLDSRIYVLNSRLDSLSRK
ncbi:hypothetical protein GGI24_001317 [Coemansia furcata]|nr:hypothetical protein GGI24_001317 [Coemansia furcata]